MQTTALTGYLKTSTDALWAVSLVTRPAKSAAATSIPHRLDPTPISDLDILHVRSNLDDNAGAFVARRADTICRHGPDPEITEHIMDIRVAEAGDVELHEDLVGACQSLACFQLQQPLSQAYLAQGQAPPRPSS
jgi:hypothetical protein